MTDRYQHLMHLRPKQLQTYLEERGDPPIIRKQIYDTVVAQQTRKMNSGRRVAQVAKWWEPIAAPLANEIKVVRSMQQHDRDNEQRQEVVGAYMKALLTARDMVKTAKAREQTPKAYQQWRVDNDMKPCQNDLSHWTDLIPARVQAAISDAFEALPYKPKAKRKVPFERD